MKVLRTSRKGGKSRFGVKWSAGYGEGYKTRFFETEKERETYYSKIKRKARIDGPAVLSFSDKQAVILKHALAAMNGDEMELLKAVEYWQERKALKQILLQKSIKSFLDEKYNLGRDDNWIRATRTILERYAEYTGKIFVCNCTTEQAQAWIVSMHYAPVTLKNHTKACGSFFNWCIDRNYCEENIFRKVATPAIISKEPEHLTATQTEILFEIALKYHPDLLAYLALRTFAGIRSSACSRISFEEINFEECGIKITAQNAKNNSRDYLQGHPSVLWEWLEFAKEHAKEGFMLSERQHRQRMAQVIEKAGFIPPHNALRHSFATYHVALFGNPGQTARLLTHRSDPHLLFKHYKGNASKSEAEKYFSIRPPKDGLPKKEK